MGQRTWVHRDNEGAGQRRLKAIPAFLPRPRRGDDLVHVVLNQAAGVIVSIENDGCAGCWPVHVLIPIAAGIDVLKHGPCENIDSSGQTGKRPAIAEGNEPAALAHHAVDEYASIGVEHAQRDSRGRAAVAESTFAGDRAIEIVEALANGIVRQRRLAPAQSDRRGYNYLFHMHKNFAIAVLTRVLRRIRVSA